MIDRLNDSPTSVVDDSNTAMFIMVLIGIAVVLVLVKLFVDARRRRERILALRGFAQGIGLDFSSASDWKHDRKHQRFGIFGIGSKRRAFNTISGSVDAGVCMIEVTMGDYRYETSSVFDDDSRKVTTFSYLIAKSPWDHTPSLLIRPEGFMDRMASLAGAEDINFESEVFSRMYHVSCTDRKFAYDLLDRSMIEFLIETRPPLVDLERGDLCISDDDRTWDPERFRSELDWVTGFYGRWPRHLLNRIGTEAS